MPVLLEPPPTLPPSGLPNAADGWVYAIGDIHGCYEELLLLESKIEAHAKARGVRPYIISVGDLVDRGEKSLEVVEHFVKGVKHGTHCAVIGNHEVQFLETLLAIAPQVFENAGIEPEVEFFPSAVVGLDIRYEFSPYRERFSLDHFILANCEAWFRQGGHETLMSFGCDPGNPSSWDIPPDVVRFLCGLKLSWECDTLIVTHALPEAEQLEDALRFDRMNLPAQIRASENYITTVDAVIWNREIPLIRPHPSKIHVSGHTPRPRHIEAQSVQCVMIDTGCAYGNRLTAWCANTKEFLTVNRMQMDTIL